MIQAFQSESIAGLAAPSWLLLFWCGLAASISSEWVVAAARAIIARKTDDGPAGAPRLMSTPRSSVPIAIVSGTLLAAPVYGLIFEWWHRADLAAGLIIGAAHGAIAGIVVLIAFLRRRSRERRNLPARPLVVFRVRRLVTRVVYGALLGFLYVVPPL